MRKMLPILFAITCLAASPARAQQSLQPKNYAEAKAQADRDEASMDRMTADYMMRAQASANERIVQACAAPDADTSAFTVVVRLDAEGAVAETWRSGDTELARCFERQLMGRMIAAPPRTPFLVAFEISFTE